jgi:hypothetical protein
MAARSQSDQHTAPAPTPSGDSGSNERRAVVTLSPNVAVATRRMSAAMGDVGTTEVVRRGLILLDLLLSLPDDEELVIRHKDTKELERLRFSWDTF